MEARRAPLRIDVVLYVALGVLASSLLSAAAAELGVEITQRALFVMLSAGVLGGAATGLVVYSTWNIRVAIRTFGPEFDSLRELAKLRATTEHLVDALEVQVASMRAANQRPPFGGAWSTPIATGDAYRREFEE